MNLKTYFASHSGLGVMATADDQGKVDTAIYARPHILEDGRVAFVMRDRLTRRNLLANPRANYLFVEEENGFKGVRLFLRKVGESADQELAARLSRRKLSRKEDLASGPRYIVSFEVEQALELIGGSEIELH